MLPKAQNEWTLNEAAHLLNRAGFGRNPEEIRSFHALGRHRAVKKMVSGSMEDDSYPLPEWATQERALADFQMRMEQRRETMAATRGMSAEEAEKKRRRSGWRCAENNSARIAGIQWSRKAGGSGGFSTLPIRSRKK